MILDCDQLQAGYLQYQLEGTVKIVLPLYFGYASVMLPNAGGTNRIFENQEKCVWLARAQAGAIIDNVPGLI